MAYSKSSYETLWRKTVSNGDGIISCDDSGTKYEVKLAVEGSDERNLGLGLGLQVWRNWASGNIKRMNRGNKLVESEDWRSWAVVLNNQGKVKGSNYSDGEVQY